MGSPASLRRSPRRTPKHLSLSGSRRRTTRSRRRAMEESLNHQHQVERPQEAWPASCKPSKGRSRSMPEVQNHLVGRFCHFCNTTLAVRSLSVSGRGATRYRHDEDHTMAHTHTYAHPHTLMYAYTHVHGCHMTCTCTCTFAKHTAHKPFDHHPP